MTKVDIFEKLKRNCQVRDLVYEDYVYNDEIDSAINVVNQRRGFTPTNTKPYEEKYADLIYRLAMHSIAKMGAEGQTSHSENGISRGYGNANQYPNELLDEVIPLIKV